MKEKYIPAEIEIFMFEQKQVIVASGEETSTSTFNHDNALFGYDDLL